MGNIKKINGHNIKDDIARDLANMMYENFKSMVNEFKDIKAEVQDIERIIDEKLDDDLLGKIDYRLFEYIR